MIDGSKKRNRQLAFELQNSHVCEKRSKANIIYKLTLDKNRTPKIILMDKTGVIQLVFCRYNK